MNLDCPRLIEQLVMKATLHKLHRYLSLTLAVLWLTQALTGLVMVFHWELDDALVAGAVRPIDVASIGRQVSALNIAQPPDSVTALYPTAGAVDRFDIYIENPAGETDIARVNGAGEILLRRPLDHDFAHAGLIQAAVVLHQSLFMGDRGRALIGISGAVLLSNLVLGSLLAWPHKKQWSRALLPPRAIRGAPTIYSWHRALGLWLGMPASIFIVAGILLAFDDAIESALIPQAVPVALSGAPAIRGLKPAPVAPEFAMQKALGLYAGSTMAGVKMPSMDSPWYRVRLRQPGEWRRVFGRTTVYISAVSGDVLLSESAFAASPQQRFLDILYPIHTGEIGGLAGRVLDFAVALWLLAMLGLGLSLWWARQQLRRA